jgi:hypothetical protein
MLLMVLRRLRLLDAGLVGSSRSERRFTADESTGPSRIIPTPVEARMAESLESPRDTEGRTRDLDLEPGRCIFARYLVVEAPSLSKSKASRASPRCQSAAEQETVGHPGTSEVLCAPTLHPPLPPFGNMVSAELLQSAPMLMRKGTSLVW